MSTVARTWARESRFPRVNLPAPHAGQQYVRQHAKRFNWLAAGRRWRKTTLVMSVTVEAMLRAKAGQKILWGAPTWDQVLVGAEEAKRAAASVAEFKNREAIFPGGGKIIYRSLDDPDNARAHTFDGAVIDEAGDVHHEAWSAVIRPTLIDTGGWAWILGTPRGLNWFWEGCSQAQDDPDSAFFNAPTLGCRIERVDGLSRLIREPHPLENPNIPWSEVVDYFKKNPESIFRQEILAEFISDSGAVFRNIEACSTANTQERALPFHTYLIGCDWAQRDDFSVFGVLDTSTKELVHLERFNQIEYMLQAQRLIALCERFRPVEVISEVTGNPALNEMLRQMFYNNPDGPGLRFSDYVFDDYDEVRELSSAQRTTSLPISDFVTTHPSKVEAVQALALAFERGQIRIPHARFGDQYAVLAHELRAYTSKRLPSGAIQYAAPTGQHDDTVSMLGQLWSRARRYMSGEQVTPAEQIRREVDKRFPLSERPSLDPTAAAQFDLMRHVRQQEGVIRQRDLQEQRESFTGLGDEDGPEWPTFEDDLDY